MKLPRCALAISASILTALAAVAPAQENVWTSHGPTDVGWVNDLAIADSVAYAATRNGVFRSDDRAASWQQSGLAGESIARIASFPGAAVILAMDFPSSDPAVGGTLYASRDGGKNWTPVPGVPPVTLLAIDPRQPSTAYVGVDNAASWSRSRDMLPAMGFSGLGSADIEITSGAAPVVTARVFNDAGPSGTTGFTEEAMRAEEALRPGQMAVLLIPADFAAARFNVGVRTLGEGASVTFTLRNAAGSVLETSSRAFPHTYHEQQIGVGLLRVSEVPPGGSIAIAVTSGSAILYGATVDNRTGDPSLQIARAAP